MENQPNRKSPIEDTGTRSPVKTLETRVGYMTLSVIRGVLSDYIRSHTVDGKYMGDTSYLVKYAQITDYINQGNEPRGTSQS